MIIAPNNNYNYFRAAVGSIPAVGITWLALYPMHRPNKYTTPRTLQTLSIASPNIQSPSPNKQSFTLLTHSMCRFPMAQAIDDPITQAQAASPTPLQQQNKMYMLLCTLCCTAYVSMDPAAYIKPTVRKQSNSLTQAEWVAIPLKPNLRQSIAKVSGQTHLAPIMLCIALLLRQCYPTSTCDQAQTAEGISAEAMKRDQHGTIPPRSRL